MLAHFEEFFKLNRIFLVKIMEKPCIILLGAPGSGKGTRASVLSQILGVPQIATGDLFRKNLKEMTSIGKIAKSYIDKGELVPDSVTADMLEQRLQEPDAQNGFLLDGFPRTIEQAKMLDKIMNTQNRKINAVLYLNVSDEEIVDRLSGRLICEKCQTPYHKTSNPPKSEGVCDKCGGKLITRADDNPQTILNRLNVYHQSTFPLVDFYQKRGLIFEISGKTEIANLPQEALQICKKLGFIK